jgi:hypothetical protein
VDYRVAIVSHNRAQVVGKYTLSLLDRLGVSRDQVDFFVAPEQVPIYSKLDGVGVVEGKLGLAANRNYLIEHYPAGTRVLSLDDDLIGIAIHRGEDLQEITAIEFGSMVEEGFDTLAPWRAALWGISPMHNDRFKAPRLQVGAPSIEGPLFGFVAGQADLRVPLQTRYEDVERVCRAFENGWNVVRLGEYVHKQSTASAGGRGDRSNGCRDVRRLEQEYPTLVEHRFGKLASADPCRPAIRSRRWVDNPTSLDQIDDMRERIQFERPRELDSEIHEWFLEEQTMPSGRLERRIENAVVELRVALDAVPAYGRGDEVIEALRVATQKHYKARKPTRVMRAAA